MVNISVTDVDMTIKVPTWNRELFSRWCRENYIACEWLGSDYALEPAYDRWYIGVEEDRMLAILRWT